MLRLRPYRKCDAASIISWCKTQRAARQWSAGALCDFGWPLAPAHLNQYYQRQEENPNTWQMTAVDEAGRAAGHFTMRFKPEDNSVHLGFVILDDAIRGQGYGREMTELAVRYAFDILKTDAVTLFVFLNNLPALRCYEAAGFLRDIQGDKDFTVDGQTWPCARMVRRRTD